MGTDYHQQTVDGKFKMKTCNQSSRSLMQHVPPKMKMIRWGCKCWLHVSMQQVCKVHKLNVNWVGLHWYSRSSRINKIQVDDYEKMAQLSQTDVVLLIEYDVLAILY